MRPFGRFFYLPMALAKQGHEVTVLVLNYSKGLPEEKFADGVMWISESLRPLLERGGPFAFLRRAQRLIDRERPDCLIAFSDTWYGIVAQWLAARNRIPCVIDAYDNYESYIPWAKPLHWAWRVACSQAEGLSAAGPELLELMYSNGARGLGCVVPMAADPCFKSMDRGDCRAALGLPQTGTLLGYAGSLHANRGIETLFEVVRRVSACVPSLRLVISGRRQRGVDIPADFRGRVIDLGFVPDENVPKVINSLDVALVMNRDSDFGRYSYPVKLYEAMACGVPVVASHVPGTSWVLRDYPEFLARPEDADEFTNKVVAAIGLSQIEYAGITNWQSSGELFAEFLDNVIHRHK